MSFQDDVFPEYDPIVFERDATTITIQTTDGGAELPPIELPALSLRRSEVSPTWLALHDAEQNHSAGQVSTRKEPQMTDPRRKHEEAIAAMVAHGFVLSDFRSPDFSPEHAAALEDFYDGKISESELTAIVARLAR